MYQQGERGGVEEQPTESPSDAYQASEGAANVPSLADTHVFVRRTGFGISLQDERFRTTQKIHK